MNNKKNSMADISVIGLALFAMFFGAGNLIFPPFLGMQAGSEWLSGFLSFFTADIGLALLAIFAIIKSGKGSMDGITGKLGNVPSKIINTLIVLCIGPFLAIPRTAATTYEMGVVPTFPGVNTWVFGAIFFGLVLLLTIRATSVVDVIGKFLTPLLVIALLGLIIAGIVNPIGEIAPYSTVETVKEGVLAGYQTLDVLASMVFVLIIISSAKDKGYTEEKDTMAIVMKSSIFAAVALCIVYGGLAYLGATTSGGGFEGYNQTGLVVAITRALIGEYGVLVLAIIVFFACLTTAIGLVSSCGTYFATLTNGKVSYEKVVVATVLFSYLVSNLGISTIISIAAPILNLLYPVVLVMIFLTFFQKRIENRNVFIYASLFAFIISAADVLTGFGLEMPFLSYLPFASYQLGWIVPAIIGGIVGKFVPMSTKARLHYAQERKSTTM